MGKGKSHRVDWMNHLIGLISVMVGILIAFWLEDYRETKKEQRLIESFLTSIKSEIQDNREQIVSTSDRMHRLQQKLSEVRSFENIEGFIQMSGTEMKNHLESFPEDTMNVDYKSDGRVSFRPRFSLTIYSLEDVIWKTGLSAELLSSMDFELISLLSGAYESLGRVMVWDEEYFLDFNVLKKTTEGIERLDYFLLLNNAFAESLNAQLGECLQAIDDYLAEN